MILIDSELKTESKGYLAPQKKEEIIDNKSLKGSEYHRNNPNCK